MPIEHSNPFVGFEGGASSPLIDEPVVENMANQDSIDNLRSRMDNLEQEILGLSINEQQSVLEREHSMLHIENEMKKVQLQIQLTESKLKVEKLQKEFNSSKLPLKSESARPDRLDKFLARQTVGGDLPSFSGNPEDWPMFKNRFKITTETCEFSSAENVTRLQKCLRGEALESVRSLLVSPDSAPEIITILERRFGRPEYIIKAQMAKCKMIPPIRDDKPMSLVNFSIAVRNLTVTLQHLNRPEYLKNPQLIEDIESKLTPMMAMLWADTVESLESYDLTDLSKWLDKKANGASLRIVPERTNAGTCENVEIKRFKPKVHNVVVKQCNVCHGNCDNLTKCEKFKKLHIDEKWKIVREERLCFSCLASGHNSRSCWKKQKCSHVNCDRNHHSLLHKNEQHNGMCANGVGMNTGVQTKLRIIPVVLSANGRQLKTFALMDPGSTTTMLSKDLANELNLNGPIRSLCIKWANGNTTTDGGSKTVSFGICGTQKDARKFEIRNARTIKNLPLPSQTIDKNYLLRKYPYLKRVQFDGYFRAQPKLLIGEDNALIMATRELVHDAWNSPIVSKTWLGWVVSGNDGNYTKNGLMQNVFHVQEMDENIHELVKQSFRIENIDQSVERIMSREDQRAEKLLESTAKRTCDGRWEVGLIWRDSEMILPESKESAFHRLLCLEKKLDKNSDLRQRYGNIIDDYLEKGYLRKVQARSAKCEPSRSWYLPHFPVQNPMKPNKVRIVLDAAAKSHGMCLNDALLQGPDLLKSLIGVLFKFRQGKIGFVADIKEMFHRIKIREEDIPCQRILWRGDRRSGQADIYELTVMMFGATCSPSAAIFCKDRNAKEFLKEKPEAVRQIFDNHYMDDYLGCADNIGSATELINDIILIHEAGGFEIRGWRSSSKEVMEKIPKHLRSDSSDLIRLSQTEATSRVLGILWNPVNDEFTFGMDFKKIDNGILKGEVIPTKREVLRVVMSVFDPIGFVTNLVIRGRILLQNIWQSGIGWDDKLAVGQQNLWRNWVNNLWQIPQVKVGRYYSLNGGDERQIELHIFADASEEAYAAVAYMRVKSEHGIFVSFVAARAKVAPLKPLSIPRLELLAATLACKLKVHIINEHNIKFTCCKLWIDSMTVFHWIRAEAKRFKQFVAQRLGIISEVTNVEDWNWLPSQLNVADEATRSTGVCHLDSNSRWITGPEFLVQPESNWPKRKEVHAVDISNEQMEFVGSIHQMAQLELPDCQRFSNWQRLLRSTAWLIRFKNNLFPDRRLSGELTADEIGMAETLLIQRSQQMYFSEEINSLRNDKLIKKGSKLYALTPKLDDNILKLSGRIENIPVENIQKNPIILDGKDLFVHLLVTYYHDRANHIGHGMVLNELKQRFWIIGASKVLKAVRYRCNKCKLLFAKPKDMLMGQLPVERLTPGNPAFTFTGMDYFGPVMVKVGRRQEKRYGVLFTCLTVRAVHLEIAHSLTTDSCIMAIRRFIARRGCPKVIYSDNGTNLRGADTELRANLNEIDQDQMRSKMTCHRIEWKFNPPAAPHMGGVWERLVRSVKTALYVTLKCAVANDEVLSTLMMEAEHTINSRPLVEVSTHPDELESLTPNHFLIGRSSSSAPIGIFDDKDLILRKKWRASQRLADLFWQRWLKEYVPTLIKRSKWFQQGKKLSVGDVVIVMDSSSERGMWPRGIITAVYPGRDGHVRVVDVRTIYGTYKRPLAKLCVLGGIGTPQDSNTGGENVACKG